MGSAAAVAPAGWHDDPQGSGRLRYYDGMRWTNHYAEQTRQQEPPAPPVKQLDEQMPEAVVEDVSAEADEVEAEDPVSEESEPSDAEESEAGDVQTQVIEPEAEEPAATDTEDAAAEAPTAVVNAEPQRAFCGACGHSIAATARFCSACGETQAIS
jgi:cytoskeletal protein RodZ